MTAANLDPFAFASQEQDDAAVLALFNDWLDASREADRLGDAEEDQWNAALDRRDEIEEEIVATPGGPAGLAIKVYLFLRLGTLSGWAGDLATVRCPDLFKSDQQYLEERFIASILSDAAKQAPELAELAAPIIHEDAALIDADIELRWCQEVSTEEGLSTYGGKDKASRIAELQGKLAAALHRIAKTEAKTPRGWAIKARHEGICALARPQL